VFISRFFQGGVELVGFEGGTELVVNVFIANQELIS